VTASSRVIFQRRGDSFGQPSPFKDNIDIYSIKADGTGLTPLAGSADEEAFAAIF